MFCNVFPDKNSAKEEEADSRLRRGIRRADMSAKESKVCLRTSLASTYAYTQFLRSISHHEQTPRKGVFVRGGDNRT